MLGILALLPVAPDAIAEDVAGAYQALREQKGFGQLMTTREQALLCASSLVAYAHLDSPIDGQAATTSKFVLAEQAMATSFIASAAQAAFGYYASTSS